LPVQIGNYDLRAGWMLGIFKFGNKSCAVCILKVSQKLFKLKHLLSALDKSSFAPHSDNFKKSFMKACLCLKGKDINTQLQVENSIFPRFGRSRGSEKLTSIAKNNFQKTKTSIACGVKDSEAVVVDHDKMRNNVCIKTTAVTIPCNLAENKEHNNINGINETTSKVQRTSVLHTDL
jgi:hypothetical protein